MTGKLTGIAVFLIALMVTVVVAATVVYILTISSTGVIELEYSLTADPATINWGTVKLNTPVIETVVITNVGTKDVASLNLTWGNPSPNLISYKVDWDCEGLPLAVGYYVPAAITLTVTDGEAGAFSLDLFINDNVP